MPALLTITVEEHTVQVLEERWRCFRAEELRALDSGGCGTCADCDADSAPERPAAVVARALQRASEQHRGGRATRECSASAEKAPRVRGARATSQAVGAQTSELSVRAVCPAFPVYGSVRT